MTAPTPPLPVIAFTLALGESARAEARQCEASFRHWHPDIPFLSVDEAIYRLLSHGHPPAWGGEILAFRTLVGWFLSHHAKRVVYLDADVFVLGRLEGLIESSETTLTADWSTFTMRVPEAPRINSGVLASSDPAFWQAWTAAVFSILTPAVDQSDFDQLALRLLVMAGSVRAQVIDGQPGRPYYNVSIGEQPGDWRVENRATFKGKDRALVLHQAGWEKRGIAAADPALHAHLGDLVRERSGPTPDFASWWQADGSAFAQMVRDHMATWPISTLEGVVPDVYARAPGAFRTLAPIAYDRHRKLDGTGWERMLKREWQAYLYCKERDSAERRS